MSDFGKKLDVKDVKFGGKRVLLRVDFNVPMNNGVITDASRIIEALPTIKYILEQQPKYLIVCSHYGRPKGQRVAKLSLAPVSVKFAELLGRDVEFVDDCVGPKVQEKISKLPDCAVLLLENLRYKIEEEGKGVDAEGNEIKATPEQIEKFRNELSQMCDIYVNDAFGTCHRAHSSIVGIKVSIRCCGFLIGKELQCFNAALCETKRPFLSIMGGAKVHDKIKLIKNLLAKVDRMIIGGGMAYTFLKELYNMPIGDSLYDPEGAKEVKSIMEYAKQRGVEILFPVDFVCSSEFGENGTIKNVTREEGIPDGFQGLDCGPETVKQACAMIITSKTILWNGPVGVSEMMSFAKGSRGFLDAVIESTAQGAISIIGGGDTGALVNEMGVKDKITHVSTGGGASLQLLEGSTLPGVEALCDRE